MNRSIWKWAATACALTLALGSCGSNDTTGSTTSSSTTTTSVAFNDVPTATEMKGALLSADDLGSKWMLMQTQEFASREGIPTLDPGIWCPAAADSMANLGNVAGASGAITGLRGVGLAQGSSHQISEQLFTGTSVDEFVTLVESGVETCAGTPWTNANGHVVQVDLLTSPAVGDRSVSAISMITTQEAGTDFMYRTRILVARRASVVMILQEVDTQKVGSTQLMDASEWGSLVSKAAEKFSSL